VSPHAADIISLSTVVVERRLSTDDCRLTTDD
jgi:hypothetical protein